MSKNTKNNIDTEECVKIFKEALEKWGVQFQLNMVAEECCELTKAVLKLNRKVNRVTSDNVIDEMVDVYIMLGQLEIILKEKYINKNCDINDIIHERFEKKMTRLREMLRKERK